MSFCKYACVLGLLAALLTLVGCEPPATTNTNPAAINTANTNVNSAPPTSTKASEPIAGAPFTMAMLDAILADEALAKEARTTAQLTDEEMDKLKTRSRNAVLELSADPADDESRSTTSSTSKAIDEVKKILGDERGNKLIAFIQNKWTGDTTTVGIKPNSVPSDTRVVVNIPAYRMDLFQDGRIIKSYKIGIGYPEFPLPTGLRKAEKLIFNPTWTPPDEPWVKGKVSPGKTVEAGDKLNPLGPIKIPIGLPSLIHGGKSAGRLGTFASHGCVGLTNTQVQDLAVELAKLAGEPITLQDVKTYEKSKTETKEVNLGKDIPVELRYETIVAEDGVLKIYRDVYERGTNTRANLERVLSENGVQLDNLDDAVKKQLLDAVDDMAVDASGKPVDAGQAANSNSQTNSTSSSNSNANSSTRVTRNIKGRKEVSIKVPQLAGKGYPAPVQMRSS